MATVFQRWANQIETARDDEERRAVLSDIARWRAAHLTDIPALREAAFAMSRLYVQLGDQERALHEGKSLVSLCQTAPHASREELQHAVAWLQSLGGKSVVAGPAPQRAERGRKKRREEPEREAVAATTAPADLGAAGRWDEALQALRGRHGARSELLRVWLRLGQALSTDDAAAREAQLRDLEAWLRRKVGPRPTEAAPRKPQAQPEPEPAPEHVPDDPLSQLLGRAVPKKRAARARVLEDHADAHPEDIDRLGALALQHHVRTDGPTSPAPWLVGIVGRALARGPAPETRRVLNQLAEQGAYAVTAYHEWPFERLVEVVTAAEPQGWKVTSFRRGVLARIEPPERKVWTLRLERRGVERMLAVAPPAEEPWSGEEAERLARRLPELCGRVVLLAPGAGNAELRERAGALGVDVLEEADPARLLEAMAVASEVETPRPEPTPREEVPEGPRPDDLLREALTQPEPPAVDDLTAILGRFRRVHHAFSTVRGVLEDAPPEQRDVLTGTVLRALDAAAPEGVRLPEGTTLGVRAAAVSEPGGPSEAALTGGSTADRFGGPGGEAVVRLARALAGAGWQIERVYRGPTGRERREQPALKTLGDAADGIWRLLVEKDGTSGEVWFLGPLSPEGRAAVPQLLRREANRVVVIPIEADLLEGYDALGGPPPIGWTGEEAEQVVEAVSGWE